MGKYGSARRRAGCAWGLGGAVASGWLVSVVRRTLDGTKGAPPRCHGAYYYSRVRGGGALSAPMHIAHCSVRLAARRVVRACT